MSEKLLKFLLSELELVRVVCRGKRDGKPCGAVMEMPLERLGDFDNGKGSCKCPFCGQEFCLFNERGEGIDPFSPLIKAIAGLKKIGDRLPIQFVLPAPEKPAAKP